MGVTLSHFYARWACHVNVERLSAFFVRLRLCDVFGDEKLFMLDDVNERFLDLVEVS